MTRRTRRSIECTLDELESPVESASSFKDLWVASLKAEDGRPLTPEEDRLLDAPQKHLTEQAKGRLAALKPCPDGGSQ